jgi:hypothetical protein
MAEDKTFTKDELDAAVTKAVEAIDVDGLKSKIDELIGDNKKLKADLRKTQEVKPEDMAALEHQVDELTSKLTVAEKAARQLRKRATRPSSRSKPSPRSRPSCSSRTGSSRPCSRTA